MPSWFGPSLQDRAHLVQTLRALGPTPIGGLAAALGWSPRRTERMLRLLIRRGEGGITFTSDLERVQVGTPPPDPSAAAPAPPAVAAAPGLPGSPPRSGAAAASAPPADAGPRSDCPHCHRPMLPTVTGESVVCPSCGRLALAPRAAAPTASSAGRAGPSATAAGGPSDRRSQEMLASYVTSRPIPCPRCRAPLRHEAVATFRCPACGEGVRFDGPDPPRPPLPSPTRVAPPSPAPAMATPPRA